VGWPISNVGAVADTLSADYGVSLVTVGLFTTALFVVHATLQAPAGKAVDAFGARRIGFVSAGVALAANGLALVAPDPALAFCSRAVAGVATALGFIAGLAVVRSHGGTPFAQGLYGGVALAGGGVALAVVPQLVGVLSWRAPYVSAMAVALLAAALLALVPADAHALRPEPARDGRRAPGVLRDRRLYRVSLLYAASFSLSVVLGNWIVPLLTRAGGSSEATAGAVGSLILIGGILSRPLGGALLRRHPLHIKAILGASLAASALGTVLVALVGPVAVSILGVALVGLAAGIPFAASFAAAARLRPDAPAAAIALVNMSANLVIVVGTPLLGLTFRLPGDGRIGFAAVVVLWLAALAVLPTIRELDPVPAAGSGDQRRAVREP
jgi:predicted MFS family arabinose efflux permease